MKTMALGDFLGDLDARALYQADTVPTAEWDTLRQSA